jgi:hypothetical protein
VKRGEVPAGVVFSTEAAISDKIRLVDTFPRLCMRRSPIPQPSSMAPTWTPEKKFLAFLKTDEVGRSGGDGNSCRT